MTKITKVYFSKGYSDEHMIISTDREGFFKQFEVPIEKIISWYNKYEPKFQCKCCKELFFSQQLEGDNYADGYCSCNWLEKCDTNHCHSQSPHRENHCCEEESK